MTKKTAEKKWEELIQEIHRSTTVKKEDSSTILARKRRLEKSFEEWAAYYFPNYADSKPAPFHIKSSKKIIESERLYAVRAWSRELAKSTRTMIELIYLSLLKKIKNVLHISHSEDQSTDLLTPYYLVFEYNQRIIQDYGHQKTSMWQSKRFKIKSGTNFRAIGAGQNPRGTKNENFRPDVVVFDDIDTDKEVRNVDMIRRKWNWIEQAVIPAMSISGSRRIVFLGNIIGRETVITKAIERAKIAKNGYVDIRNIRDAKGKSVWKRNSESDIDEMLSMLSYASAQKEYFNNPMSEGSVFKSITWGRVPRIDSLKLTVIYGDPSYSNRVNKQNSRKCTVIVAKLQNKYYILNAFLAKATANEFVTWFTKLQHQYGHERIKITNWVECNSLQLPYFEQILQPEFRNKGVNIKTDERKKPGKYERVEGNLEPKNRDGCLIFNEKEKDNKHMKLLEEQFLVFSESTADKLDGPDAVEGAVWILDNTVTNGKVIKSKRYKNIKYSF